MAITTRLGKGSTLTIEELDENLNHIYSSFKYVGNSSEVTNINWSEANTQEINIDNNPILTFSGAYAGQKLSLLLKQTGTSQKKITWDTNVRWQNNNPPLLPNRLSIKLDETFNFTGFDSTVYGMKPIYNIMDESGYKILCFGAFSSYQETLSKSLIELNADGSINKTFGEGFDSLVLDVVLQSDELVSGNEKLICVGQFTSYQGIPVNYICRLLSDGTLDETFSSGTGFNSPVRTIQIQEDGTILCGGDFTEYDGNLVGRIVCLNSDGTINESFVPSNGFDNTVTNIKIRPDYKIVCAGLFNTFDGYINNYIIVLNSDGTIDNTFSSDGGFDARVGIIAIDNNNNIFCGGSFQNYNEVKANHIIKLTPTGAIDTGFEYGEGLDADVLDIFINPFGKILLVGNFSKYNFKTSNNIVRINSDGSFDDTFIVGSGFDYSSAFTIFEDSYNRVVVGGNLTSFNQTDIPDYLVKLAEDTPIVSYNRISFTYNGTDYIGRY